MNEQAVRNLTEHFEKEVRQIIEEEKQKNYLDLYSLEVAIEKRLSHLKAELLSGVVNSKHKSLSKKKLSRVQV